MTTEISSQSKAGQNLTQSTISGSLASRALFWTPRFVTGTPFSYNLPFTFWLADVARPTRVMALGMTDGESYFGFCQALDKLNIAAMCSGYGTWASPGGKHADNEEVPADINSHNTINYSDFSRVAWREALAALKSVEPETLDLLIVNLATDVGDGDLFFDLAVRKMSDQGIIVIHDLSACHADATKATCLSTLRKNHPTFQFGEDADAVMVALVGQKQDKRLQHFARMKTGTAEFNTVQAVFRQLGAGHYYAWNSAAELANAKKAERLAAQTLAAHDELAQKHADLNAAYEERSKKIAHEQARLFDLRQEVSDLQSHLTQNEQQVETMQSAYAALEQQMADEKTALLAQIEDLSSRPPAPAQDDTSEADTSNHSADIKKLELQLQTRFQELAILQREILAVEKNANARIKAVKNSTSWRVTAPLRAVSQVVRRKKK